MSGSPRTAYRALFSICVLGCLIVSGQARQALQPVTPEPPLAEGVAPLAPQAAPASAIVDPPVPIVTVRVRAPAQAKAGEEQTVRILVDNISKATAYHVAIRAPLPTNAEVRKTTPDPVDAKAAELSWQFGTLEGGAAKEITLVLVPNGSGEVRTTARVSFEHGQSVITHLNKPSLKIQIKGPAEAAVNSTIRYVLTITNNGSAAAENVEVTDTLPKQLKFSKNISEPAPTGDDVLRWKIASLAAGQSLSMEYEAIPSEAGPLTHTAVAASADGKLTDTAKATLTVGQPKLTITKTGPALSVPGQPLAYTITVTNTGTVAATNVVVQDQIPQERDPQTRMAFADFLSASAGGRYTPPAVRWPLGTLPAGASRAVQLTMRVHQVGKLKNVAEVQAEGVPQETAQSLTLLVDPSKRLALDIDKPKKSLEVDGELIYTIRVINPNNAPITGIGLSVSASDNVRLVEANGATNGKQDLQKPAVEFEALLSLEPGKIATYTVKIKALKEGEVTLQANATATPAIPGFTGVETRDRTPIVPVTRP